MRWIQRLNPPVALACVVALVFTLVAPTPALAKSHKNDMSLGWDNVLRLRHGETVTVLLFSKRIYSGKVESVEPNSIKISIEKKQGSLLIPRDEIKFVNRVERAKAAYTGGIMIGGGILLASSSDLFGSIQQVGCLNGVSTTNGLESCSKINHTGLEIAGYGVSGAGLVVAILIGKPRTIYQVDTPPQAATEDTK